MKKDYFLSGNFKFFICFISSFYCLQTFHYPQPSTILFDRIPYCSAWCIYQDSKGFAWFGESSIHNRNNPIQINAHRNNRSVNTKDLYSDSVNINAEDWAARGGYWDFSGKVIKAKGFIGHNKAYYKRRVFTDFIYEVKICKIAEDGTFGLLFRYDEKHDEGYLLHFWPHGGCRFELIKGGQTRLRSVEVSQPMHQIIGTNVYNTVKIIAHGSKFEIYLNGYLLDTIVDRQYSSGRVGLFVGGDPRQIALFEVTTIKVP